MSNPQHISNSCYGIALGKLSPQIPVHFLTSLSRITLSKCNPQDLSTLCWSFAKLNHNPSPDLFSHICKEITKRQPLKDFSTMDLSNLLWSFATLHPYRAKRNDDEEEESLTVLIREMSERIQECNAQDLSQALWAAATLKAQSAMLLCDQLPVLFASKPSELSFTDQALANCLWAMVTISYSPPEIVLRRLEREVVLHLPTFSSHALATTAWSLAKLPIQNRTLLHQEILGRKLTGFQDVDFANILSALAMHKQVHMPLCQHLYRELQTRDIRTFSSHSLSRILWSFATLRFRVPCLFEQIHNGVVLTQPWTCQDLANLAWSMGTLEEFHPPLLDQLAEETRLRSHEFSLRELSNLVWALAVSGYQSDSFCAHVAEAMMKAPERDGFQLRDFWSFACMDGLHISPVRSLFRQVVSLPDNIASEMNHPQLEYVHLAWMQSSLQLQGDDDMSTPAWLTTIARPMTREVHVSSKIHLEIASLLRPELVEYDHVEVEAYIKNCLSIDMLLPRKRIAIEVDGPYHFFLSPSQQVVLSKKGSSKFKQRLIERAGYRFISVSVLEFQSLDARGKSLFVRKLGQEIMKW